MAIGNQYFAIVPAAGVGSRMQSTTAKQYLTIQGRTILEITLSKLLTIQPKLHITVCTSTEDQYWPELQKSVFSNQGMIEQAYGGETRAHSVINGLKAIQPVANDNDWVLVHDAARPCFSVSLVESMIAQLAEDRIGGILAEPVKDTLKKAQLKNSQPEISTTVAREDLWQAQTPQLFRYGVLSKAYQSASDEIEQLTDEASAVERLGLSPKLIASESSNIKVTTPADLQLAEYWLKLEQQAKSEVH